MDGSKNIEAFLRYASKSLKRPTEPSRKKSKDNHNNTDSNGSIINQRPPRKSANITASYQTYKSKSSAIRPPSRITKQWNAPVTLRIPTNSKGIQSLEKLSSNKKKQYKFKKPHPPNSRKVKGKKYMKHRGKADSDIKGVASRGNKFAANTEVASQQLKSLSPSERIGTNYSISTLCLTLKLIGDLKVVQENKDDYTQQIEKRWKALKESYIKENKLFLKIDTSKLPLWTFDTTPQTLNDDNDNNNDNNNNNKSNSSNNSDNTIKYAYAKYYNGQAFHWEKCKILSYDPVTNMYTIEFIESRKTKKLRSMFISFADYESISETEKRILTAKEEREHTKIVLRFLHFVEMQKDSINMEPPPNLEVEILSKLALMPMEESQEIAKLILEFRENYYNSQKKAAAIYHLMSPLNDPLRHYLKLPGPAELRADNVFGCDAKSFIRPSYIRGQGCVSKQNINNLQSAAIFMRKGTVNAVMKTSYTWYPHFESVCLFETEAFAKKLEIEEPQTKSSKSSSTAFITPPPKKMKNRRLRTATIAAIAAIHLAEQPEGGDEVTKKQHKSSLNHIFRRKPLFILRNKIQNSRISLEDFHQLQTYHIEAVMKQMHKVWRNEIIDSLQKLHSSKFKFDVYTTKLELLDPRFIQLMKRIDLQMSYQLCKLIIRSFDEFITFVKDRSLTKEEESRLMNDYERKSIENIIDVTASDDGNENDSDNIIYFPLLLNVLEKEKKRSYSIYSNASNSESDDEQITASNGIGRSLNRIVTNSKCLYGSAVRSLINIEMEIDMNSVQTNFITLSPTLEEIENRFITTIESGFNQCNIIEAPVKYILQFISFTDDKSLFGEFDSLLHQKHEETKSQISQLLRIQFDQISIIVKLYQEFASILNIDDEKLIDYIFDECPDGYKEKRVVDSRVKKSEDEAEDLFDGYRGESGPTSVQSEIRRFSAIRDEILLKSHNEEYIGIFAVNFQTIKQTIAAKASNIAKRLTDQVLVNAQKKYLQLLTEYNMISDKLNAPIENEKDVFATRTFLAETPDLVLELTERHYNISERIRLLGEFYVNESYECFEVSWTLYQWPMKIEKLKDECSFRIMSISRKLQQIITSEEKAVDERVHNIKMEVVKFRKFGDYEKVDYFAGEAAAVHGHLENIHDKAVELNEREINLDSSPTEFMDLERIMRDFSPYFRLWTTYSDAISDVSNWKTSSFWLLKTSEILEKVALWKEDSSTLLSHFHKERIRDPRNVAEKYQEHVLIFSQYLDLIKVLKHHALKDRHWLEISNILGFEIKPSTEISLNTIIEKESHTKIDILKDILVKAEKELSCEMQFEKVSDDWHHCNAKTGLVKSFQLNIIISFDETFASTDDLIIRVEEILKSPFSTSVKADADALLKDMSMLQAIFRTCRSFQDTAILLCGLFNQENIRSVMAAEARKFTSMLSSWKRAGNDIKRQPSLSTICEMPNIYEKFKSWLDIVKNIDHKKQVYLNSKRAICNRLYLLNDADLMEMMSIENHVLHVEKFVRNAFPGIITLNKSEVVIDVEEVNDEDEKKGGNVVEEKRTPSWLVDGLNGFGEDNLKLQNAVEASVEKFPEWLNVVQHEMQSAMRNEILNLESSMEKRILYSSLQVALIHDKILWNRLVEDKIMNQNLGSIWQYVNDDIMFLIESLKDKNSALNARHREIQSILHWKLTARDLASELDRCKVSSTKEYEWLKHPRYTTHKEVDANSGELVTTLSVQVIEGDIKYGNEFLNAESSMMITPLGDKYIRVMTSSYICCYGNTLHGDEGTYETSIFHSVANSIGLPSFLYKCQKGSNAVSLSRFIRGITSSGVWGGFVDYDKLHVQYAASLVLEMRQAMQVKRAKKSLFKDFKIDHGFHLCILNSITSSISKKKVNRDFSSFRALHISMPNYNMMIKLYLTTFGFIHSTLNVNIEKFFHSYYDSAIIEPSVRFENWFLYSQIFSVITINSKNATTCNINNLISQMLYNLIQRTCSEKDCLHLKSILEGSFATGDVSTEIVEMDLEEEDDERLVNKCQSLGITPYSSFIASLKSLENSINTSNKPSLIYGREGTGKSMIPKVIYSDKKDSVLHVYTSAITFENLIGSFYGSPCIWHDGVISTYLRNQRVHDDSVIIFDTISSTEFLDVVLHNNNTQTEDETYFLLPSGEKLNVAPKIIIESTEIANFTPRDLSNVSLLYCNPIDSFWQGLCCSWIDKHTQIYPKIKELRDVTVALFEWLLPAMVASFSSNGFTNQAVNATLQIYSTMLHQFHEGSDSENDEPDKAKENKKKSRNREKKKMSNKNEDALEALFVYSVIWGFGGKFQDVKERSLFEGNLRGLLNGSTTGGYSQAQNSKSKAEHYFNKNCLGVGGPIERKSKLPLPPQQSIFELKYSFEKNKWVKAFIEPAAETVSNVSPFFSNIYSQPSLPLLQTLMSSNKNFYICGNDRDDRIATLRNSITNNNRDQNLFISPTHVRNDLVYFRTFVEKHINPYGNKLCKPKDGKILKIVVEDLSMHDNADGKNAILETMRQIQDVHQWYNHERQSFMDIESVSFAGTFATQTAQSQSLTRVLNRSIIINVADLSQGILQSVLSQHLIGSLDKRIAGSLCEATVDLYQSIRAATMQDTVAYPTVFSFKNIVSTLLSIFNHVDTSVSSIIWNGWSHACARVFRDSIYDANMYDSCMANMVQKYSLPLTKNSFFIDRYNFFTSLGNDEGMINAVDENEFLRLIERIEIKQEEDGVVHFPILSKKKSCLTDAAHLLHVVYDSNEDVVFAGEASLEKEYTISLLAHITARTHVKVSTVDEIMQVLQRNTTTKEKLIIAVSNANVGKMEKSIIKFNDPTWFLNVALEMYANNITLVKEIFNSWKSRCRIVYLVEHVAFKNPAIRRNTRIVFSTNSQQNDIIDVFPNTYHSQTFVTHSRAKFDNIFSSIMKKVNEISPYNAGPLHYYDFVREYERIIKFYEIYTDMKSNELTIILENIQSLKNESNDIQAKNDNLENEISVSKAFRETAVDKVKELASERAGMVGKISEIKDRLNVHQEKSDDLTKQFHTIMDPIVIQLEQVNIEFSSTSHKDEITSLKKLDKPSPQIVVVVEALCILFGIRPQKSKNDTVSGVDYFEAARKHVFNNSSNLLQRILEFDRKSITDDIFAIMMQFQAKKTFVPKAVKRQSKFCALLCKWIRIVVDFSKAMRTAAPIETELRDVAHNLEMASLDLHECDTKLAGIDENLSKYNMQKEEFTAKEVQAQIKVAMLHANFEKTALILQSLKQFEKKWNQELDGIEDIQHCVTGDAIYIATFTTYCNILPDNERTKLLLSVRNVCKEYHINISESIDMSLLIDSNNMDQTIKNSKIEQCSRWSIKDCLLIQEAPRCIMLVDPFDFASDMLNSLYPSNDPVDVISIHHIDCKKEIHDDTKLSPLIIQIEHIDNDIETITKLLFSPDLKSEDSDDEDYPPISRKIFLSTDQPTLMLPEPLLNKLSVVNLANDDVINKFLVNSMISLDPAVTKHQSVMLKEREKATQQISRIDLQLQEILQSPSLEKIYEKSDEIIVCANEWRELDDVINRVKRQLSALEEDLKLWTPIADAMKNIMNFMLTICKFRSIYKYSFHSLIQLFFQTLKQIKKQRHTKILAERIKKVFIGNTYRYFFPSFIAEDILPATFLYFWELNKSNEQLQLFKSIFEESMHDTSEKIDGGDGRSEDLEILSRMTWLQEGFSNRIAKLETSSKLKGITKALMEKPEEFYNLMNSDFTEHDFDRVTFFTARFGTIEENVTAATAFGNRGQSSSNFDLGDRILGKMTILYCFLGMGGKTKSFLHDWIIHYSKGCKLYDPAEDMFGNSIMLGSNRKPVIIVGDTRRNLIVSLRSFAESKNALRNLKLHSYTDNTADRLNEVIVNGMDRGDWIVITNMDFTNKVFWRYHKTCCSVDTSRIDKAFRLILIHSPGVSVPREIVGKCVVHRYNNKLALHDHLVHLYSIVRKSLYEYEIPAETLEEKNEALNKKIFSKRSLFCLAYFHAKLECELIFTNRDNNGIISDDIFLSSHELLVSILINGNEHDANPLIHRAIIEGIYEHTLSMNGEDTKENIALISKLFDQIFVQCNRLKSKVIDPDDPSSSFVSTNRLSDVITELRKSRQTFDEPEDGFRDFLSNHEEHMTENTVVKILCKIIKLL